MSHLPQRRRLAHGIPSWVDRTAPWFLTLCCKARGVNSLARSKEANAIRETLLAREKMGHIHVIVYVVMPDHLHIIAKLNHDVGMPTIIRNLKSYLARHLNVRWQKGFFDHRIRSDKLMRETLDYVRMNPVRAGLVSKPEEWSYWGPR